MPKRILPDRDPLHLHPITRRSLDHLSTLIVEEDLPFVFHEGYRGPDRETKFRFLHNRRNFGLSVFVVGDKKRTGLSPRASAHPWDRLAELAGTVGLETCTKQPYPFRDPTELTVSPVVHPWLSDLAIRMGSTVEFSPHTEIERHDLLRWSVWWYLEVLAFEDTVTATFVLQRLLRQAGFVRLPVTGMLCPITYRTILQALEEQGVGADLRSLDPLGVKTAWSLALYLGLTETDLESLS